MTADDPVLSAERNHLSESRTALHQMRADTQRITDLATDELTSFALGAVRAARLAALADDPAVPPFFGRIDRMDDTDTWVAGTTGSDTSVAGTTGSDTSVAGTTGSDTSVAGTTGSDTSVAGTTGSDTPVAGTTGSFDTFHIGRRHIRDGEGDPLVIDWRAPVAQPFYRATTADPMGVHRRRRFGFAQGRLTSYEDEQLDIGGDVADSRILREEIERPRVGPMRDIVATIQPDQDEIVRADLDTSVCVQGAPGTGKTAVGLHRAAYLLYTHAAQLRRAGVLVIGPNAAFLGYIGAVLPTLGEVGVAQVTVGELVAMVPVRAEEPPEVGVLKGDARMAEVLRRAVYAGIRRPQDSALVLVGSRRYRVPPEHLRRWVDDLRRGDVRYAPARDRLRALIAADVRRQREEAGGAPSDRETARIAGSATVRETVDALWPPVDAGGTLALLYTDADALARAARGLLDEDEQALLRWERPSASVGRARWSAADAVLLDEIADLLDRAHSYGHVVIDEAQDLSAMQCRAVGRRAAMGSMTILGDLAQGTTPWAATDWATSLRHLGKPAALLEPLTRGYRVPGSVLELANRLLPHVAPGLAPATAVRADGEPVRIRRAERLYVAAAEEVATLLRADGSVGVIVDDAAVRPMRAALQAAGIEHTVLTVDTEDADARVDLVGAGVVKGLEFDRVVLVEPAAIAAGPRGLARCYVALTRAVSQLVIVHDDLLPAELTA